MFIADVGRTCVATRTVANTGPCATVEVTLPGVGAYRVQVYVVVGAIGADIAMGRVVGL